MSLNNLFPGKNSLRKELKRPILKLGQIFLQLISKSSLIFRISASQTASLEPYPLPNERSNIHTSSQFRPTHSSQSDDMSIPRGNIQIALEIALSNKVDHQINTFIIRCLQDLFRPILRLIIKPSRSPKLLDTEINLLLATGSDIDGSRSCCFRQLDSGDLNTGGTCMPENAFPFRELPNCEHGLRSRNPHLRNASRLFPAQMTRLMQ